MLHLLILSRLQRSKDFDIIFYFYGKVLGLLFGLSISGAIKAKIGKKVIKRHIVYRVTSTADCDKVKQICHKNTPIWSLLFFFLLVKLIFLFFKINSHEDEELQNEKQVGFHGHFKKYKNDRRSPILTIYNTGMWTIKATILVVCSLIQQTRWFLTSQCTQSLY